MGEALLIDYEKLKLFYKQYRIVYLVTHAAIQFNNTYLIHSAIIKSRCFS